MFRRRASSSGKIHYRINIDKSMCPNPVDIYIDGDIYQHGFDGSYLDIYHKKIKVIRMDGPIVQKDQQNEYYVYLGTTEGVSNGTLTYLYDSGGHCDLAKEEFYGERITEFTPITEIIDPEEIINFTYMPEIHEQIENIYPITWQGYLVRGDHCIASNLCEGCQSVAVGYGVYSRTYNVNIIIVAPS